MTAHATPRFPWSGLPDTPTQRLGVWQQIPQVEMLDKLVSDKALKRL